MVWHLDRFTRQSTHLEELIELAVTRNVQIYAVHGGLLDLATHEGRMVARLTTSFAQYESAAGSARMARAHRDTALQGGWHGAAAYGYRAGGVIELAEAAVVRGIVYDYLAGCSESVIARRLTDRQVPTPGSGTRWHRSTVRAILRSDRLHHRRRPVGGGVAAGKWTPIINSDMVELLDAALLLRQRPSTSSSRSLLGGLARCGRCGQPLRVCVSGRRVRRYSCRRSAGGCGNGIAADRTDDHIHEIWAGTSPPVPRAVAGVAVAAEAVAAGWAETVAEYSAGRLDAETLSSRQAMHEEQLASFAAVVSVAAPTSSGAWSEIGIPERRRALLHRFQVIEIAPARRSGRFDATRIRVTPNT